MHLHFDFTASSEEYQIPSPPYTTPTTAEARIKRNLEVILCIERMNDKYGDATPPLDVLKQNVPLVRTYTSWGGLQSFFSKSQEKNKQNNNDKAL